MSAAHVAAIAAQKEVGDAAVFFRQHAMLSYPSDVTDRAVMACHWDAQACLLAGAERESKLRGWEVSWGEDWDGHPGEVPGLHGTTTCELATLWEADADGTGEPLGSRGCVDDANDDYRRVVAAELALEALGWAR